MAITFQCPSCLALHSASDVVAGRRIRCPACDQFLEVPRDGGEPPAAETAPNEADGVDPDHAVSVPNAKGTVILDVPHEPSASATVMLEAIEIEPSAVVESPSSPPVQSEARRPAAGDTEKEPERAFKPKQHLEDTDLDMTPMVDVVFQLLIFFMLTAAFALQKSLTLPKPADDQTAEKVVAKSIEDNPEYVIVRVDEFNTFHVITVDWDEKRPVIRTCTSSCDAREGNVNGVIPNKLMVEANGDALHGRVVAALDAGTATGFEEVQLSTVEDE